MIYFPFPEFPRLTVLLKIIDTTILACERKLAPANPKGNDRGSEAGQTPESHFSQTSEAMILPWFLSLFLGQFSMPATPPCCDFEYCCLAHHEP